MLKTKVLSKTIDKGREKRALLEATVIQSAETINDSVKLRDQKIIQALLDQGKETQKEVDERTTNES